MIPHINGIRHSWTSIRTNILGRTVTGHSAISYEDKREKTNNYGAGSYPVSCGRGKYEATAKITLLAFEVDAIKRSAGKKRLDEIDPFDITIVYLPEGEDGLVTHVLRNCEFKGNKRDVKQGDTMIEVEFDLILSHIEWN